MYVCIYLSIYLSYLNKLKPTNIHNEKLIIF